VVVVLGVLVVLVVLDSTCEQSVDPIVPVIPYLATPAIVLEEAGLGQSWEIVVMQPNRDALSTRCTRSLLYRGIPRFTLVGFMRAHGFDEVLEIDSIVGPFGEAAEDRSSTSKREDLEGLAQGK
jgi:hypothetical protein